MLFVKRKEGQSIIINDDLEIEVLSVRGKTAKLGIRFPENYRVMRREIYDRILMENKAAAHSASLFLKKKQGVK